MEAGAFHLPGAAADQDDDTGMIGGVFGKGKEVVAVAGDEDKSLFPGIGKDIFVQCGDGQDIPQNRGRMTPVPKEVGDVYGNIVIQQELHSFGSVICSMTRESISVRWSS